MLSESSSDEEDAPVMKKISWTSDLEGDCLPATSILSVYVAKRSSSSKKKSKKKKISEEIKKALALIYFLIYIYVYIFLLCSVYFV